MIVAALKEKIFIFKMPDTASVASSQGCEKKMITSQEVNKDELEDGQWNGVFEERC